MPQPISAADHRYTWVPLDPTAPPAPPAPESAAAGAGASGASGGADAAMGAAGAGGGAVAGAAGAMGAFAGGGPAAGVYRPVSRGPHVPASQHAGGSLGGSRAPSRGAAGGAGGVGGWQAVSPQRQRQGTPPVGLGPPPAGTVAGLLGYPAPNGAGGGGMGGMGGMSGGGGGGGGGAGFGIVDSRLALGASQWDGLSRGSHTPVGHPQRMAAVGPADAARRSRRGSCSGSVAELVAEEERWGRLGAEGGGRDRERAEACRLWDARLGMMRRDARERSCDGRIPALLCSLSLSLRTHTHTRTRTRAHPSPLCPLSLHHHAGSTLRATAAPPRARPPRRCTRMAAASSWAAT